MSITWDTLYQTPIAGSTTPINGITRVQAHRVAEILIMTANVHKDRDWGRKAHPIAIYNKVNTRVATTYAIPGGPFTTPQYNWMKVSIGYVANRPMFPAHEVVVVYHLLRHRLREGHNANTAAPLDPPFAFWSISVGIHPRIIPTKLLTPTVDPTDTTDITVLLAQDIATRINADLLSINVAACGDPPAQYAVIYDERDPIDAGHFIGFNPNRSTSRIGRIGLIFGGGSTTNPGAVVNPTIDSLFEIVETALRPYPTYDGIVAIPGWVEDSAAKPQIVATKIRAKS